MFYLFGSNETGFVRILLASPEIVSAAVLDKALEGKRTWYAYFVWVYPTDGAKLLYTVHTRLTPHFFSISG